MRIKKKNRGKKDKPVEGLAPRKLKNKEKRKLSKSMWESTHLDINKEDIGGSSDEDFESDESVEDKNEEMK